MSPEVWTAGALYDRLLRRERFFLLDVRGREDFDRFRIEGAIPLPALNVPYYEMIEPGNDTAGLDNVTDFIERNLSGPLPVRMPILAVCNKGYTSEIVAQALSRLGYAGGTLEGGMRGWGDHCAVRALTEGPDLAVYQIGRPARGCLSYMAAAGGEAIVIDPLRHFRTYLDLARDKGVSIVAVIDTHGHADHISGGTALAAAAGAPYFLHPYDAVHPVDLLSAPLRYEYLREGQLFPLGRHGLKVLHVPGHTLGMVALQLDETHLFTGDSIFLRSVGRPDLGGKAESWARLHVRSLRRLLELPGEILVLPGHFDGLAESDGDGRFAATLEELKERNEGLAALRRMRDPAFVRHLLEKLPRPRSEYLDIKRINAGLRTPAEDEAAALETGRNECAATREAA